ncbi:MAG TPA: Hsp20/alpha crystallin family protein [candidate division Zixibacteria bacterium]|nr:Hsp20/alpha crystallin family protein [candidate division Zixibacteria bacterium]
MAERAREHETRAVAPWRPFMDFRRWEREMDRMMDEFFGRAVRPWWPVWGREDREIVSPAMDVYEEKDEIVVKAELPGMKKDDIEVNISDSQLILKGEKKREEKIEEENYYRCERSYGAFYRAIDLPKEVQADKIKASFRDGVLEVRLPKSEEAKTREIKVKVE